MNMGVLGSGMVGQAISARLAELGHDAMIGIRDPGKLTDWQQTVATKVNIGSFSGDTYPSGGVALFTWSGLNASSADITFDDFLLTSLE